MKPNKEHIISQILVELEAGKNYTDTFGVIRSKSKLAESTYANYWKIANERYAAAQQQRQQVVSEVRVQIDTEAAIMGLKSKNERVLEYQAEILRMEQQLIGKIKSTFIVGNKILQSHNGDTFMLPLQLQNELRNTIKAYRAEISKLEGDYAAIKTETEIKGGQLTPDQFETLRREAREAASHTGK